MLASAADRQQLQATLLSDLAEAAVLLRSCCDLQRVTLDELEELQLRLAFAETNEQLRHALSDGEGAWRRFKAAQLAARAALTRVQDLKLAAVAAARSPSAQA